MFFGDFLTQLSIGMLSGYLALSGGLADILETRLVRWGVMDARPHVTAERTKADQAIQSSQPPHTLPSQYERGGPIPRILLENLDYQQAAVGGAGSERERTRSTAARVEEALVNVFCAYRDGDKVRATTGSGIIIDPKGIILTNAHVAQFLLIREIKEQSRCTVRMGDPARDRYEAELLYISPAWIRENADLINAEAPSGTGERDYALLRITKNSTSDTEESFPSTFPSVDFDTSALEQGDRGTSVYAAGYPAEIFRNEGPRADLTPRIATTKLLDLFTFGSNDADLIAIGNTSVGEQGASGGPILSSEGKVIGLIVTKGDPTKEGAHSLRALTLPYINRTIEEETGYDLATTLEGNVARRAQIFQKALLPFLATLLKQEM